MIGVTAMVRSQHGALREGVVQDVSDGGVGISGDSTGLCLGEEVRDVGKPLLAELGPGLLGSVYDGVQRPLLAIRAKSGDFIGRGLAAPPLDRERRWEFRPAAKEGDEVGPGDVLGVVAETCAPRRQQNEMDHWQPGSFSTTQRTERCRCCWASTRGRKAMPTPAATSSNIRSASWQRVATRGVMPARW